MERLLRIWHRLLFLFRRNQMDRDLAEEMQFHLEMKAQEKRQAGTGEKEAQQATSREFGNALLLKEVSLELWGFCSLETFLQDIRFGLRLLAKSPGSTSVILLSLALGIGANTAIFSVINAVMLRMLPVRNPEQLVQVTREEEHSHQRLVRMSFSYPTFKQLRQQNQVFTDVLAAPSVSSEVHLGGTSPSAAADPVKVQLVSANFFSVLGGTPIVGRTFAPEEDGPAGAHPVALISYGLWNRLFAVDPGVVGKKVTLENTPFTIIGVAPSHFSGVDPGQSYDLWVPITMQPQVMPSQFPFLTSPGVGWLSLIGRLKPDVSVEQARANLDLVFQQIMQEQDASNLSKEGGRELSTYQTVLLPAAGGTVYLRKEFSRPLLLLMGMVGLVLLIACANVANLLLARGSVRQKEIAVRLALGAGRGRLTRQLLTESTLLALFGAAIGALFAYWGSSLLVSLMASSGRLLVLEVHPDLRVLGFTVVIALFTGVILGLVPALRTTQVNPSPSLKEGARDLTATHSGQSLGKILVIAQVALSLVLVIGAGLLVRTLRNLQTLDPGFSRQDILLFSLDPTKAGYKDQRLAGLYAQVLERIQQIPGVPSASFSFLTPISGGSWDNSIYVEGYSPHLGENMDTYVNAVGPRFFETLRTPLVIGRDFGPQDLPASPRVAIINQVMARRFFGDRNPIGGKFGWEEGNERTEFAIVGVVGDARYVSLREVIPPTAYLYALQDPKGLQDVTFEIRAAVGLTGLMPQVRDLLKNIESRLTATDVKTLGEQIDQSLYQEQLVSTLSTSFGGLAVMLACIGLYGVMSYGVVRRTNEIGIRMALGAGSRTIQRMVLRETLLLTVLGIAIGLPAAWAATRAIASMLYGLKPTDPTTIALGIITMLAVTALSGFLPARKASRVDPMVALRHE